jgi:outer membrane beta-barrel protein
MKQFLFINLITATLTFGFLAQAETTKDKQSLEDQLKELNTDNTAPAGANREKLYAVQSRYLPLQYKSEVSMGGAYNLTGDGFLHTEQFELGYRFHFSDRWSTALTQAWVGNQFSSGVDSLRSSEGAAPMVPYAVARTDLVVTYNVFYGKFRLSSDSVFYFDQYISIGPGIVRQNTGTVGAAVGDIGFAFWLGTWGSARLGLKEYYYNETYASGAQPESNLHAHLDLGYVF